jgi:hypothetical protein
MATIALLIVALAAFAFGILALRYRGKRIVECPETRQPVCAEIGAVRAAASTLVGNGGVVITSCSRWPERAGCDQACSPAIAAAPRETLVTDIVTRWYVERACVLCGKQIRDLGGAVVPALRPDGGEIRPWSEVAPEELPSLMHSAVAVCAACGLAEEFRHVHPELVVERRHPERKVDHLPSPSIAVY